MSSNETGKVDAKDVAISVRNLGKSYTISHQQVRFSTAAEAIMHRVRNPWKRASENETFWAMEDMSFDVERGDVVGVIGRNGAGKSTLLKVLSRITEPTTGKAIMYGRVGSLLEVGTGFSGELTGRENIFLSGAILGMTRRETTQQFDAIVDFSGVEQFLDTPVKRYSSGMYVRLAFAVAAHLNPEILIVDEVLAVGDAEFQKKCLGKMGEVAQSGRTVLFVSHNMQSVSLLCNKGLFLRKGRLDYQGSVHEAIQRYLTTFSSGIEEDENPDIRPGSGEYRIMKVTSDTKMFTPEQTKTFRFRVEKRRGLIGRLALTVTILNEVGAEVAQCDSRFVGFWVDDTDTIECELSLRTPWLKPGTYRMDAYILSPGVVDKYEGACGFEVSPVLPYKHSATDDATAHAPILSDFDWSSDEVRFVNRGSLDALPEIPSMSRS
ncbi:MAG: polysaccharide ABC transporter ATP-binding protein [Armatimonadota bacterium]